MYIYIYIYIYIYMCVCVYKEFYNLLMLKCFQLKLFSCCNLLQ